MPKGLPDSQEMGFYLALAQSGMEMVAPMILGVVLDRTFGWTPWATVIGFVFGFVGGFLHLIVMLQRHDAQKQERKDAADGPGDAPR